MRVYMLSCLRDHNPEHVRTHVVGDWVPDSHRNLSPQVPCLWKFRSHGWDGVLSLDVYRRRSTGVFKHFTLVEPFIVARNLAKPSCFLSPDLIKPTS